MKAFCFNIKADMGFFKKNDSNARVFTTYNFIHKPAVLGIFGAILGYSGYDRDRKNNGIEYYEKLKNFKIAIKPLYKKPLKKTVVVFNNSSGLASEETGGVLQAKEQVIVESLGYTIFVPFFETFSEAEKKIYEKLEYMVKNKYAEYPIYFGKNEFFAYFENYRSLNVEELERKEAVVDSLVKMKDVDFFGKTDEEEFDLFEEHKEEQKITLIEELPYELDENYMYVKDLFIFTDKELKIKNNEGFWRTIDDEIIYVF
ncbi:cas crispr-associated protein Cas5 [Thermosipho africanus TCF52B]|uniref:Cas crispr-associated protein Cas5 n=1 Tax=Thermosipho africanus (strain TCF52B) TaxID=484019 RepID=B7IEF3_THEAB|nr:CRISPR-associated protein Cas5 [Thermosipho africanus]ACJ76380.1 cas crispr-associated protein Cas5 [Thermosipho africanus TCF52B]